MTLLYFAWVRQEAGRGDPQRGGRHWVEARHTDNKAAERWRKI